MLLSIILLATLPLVVESNALKDVIETLAPGTTEVGGCSVAVSIPESCKYHLTQRNSKGRKCSFSSLGLPLMVAELSSVAGGECKGNYGVQFNDKKKEKQWSLGLVYHDKDRAISGYVKTIKLDSIVEDGLPKIGINLKKLGFPSQLQEVSIGAAKLGARQTQWIGARGGGGTCAGEVLRKSNKTANIGNAVAIACDDKLMEFLAKVGGRGIPLNFLKKTSFTALVSTMDANPADEIGDALQHSELTLPKMDTLKKNSLSFTASIAKPTDCGKDLICKFLASILQDDKSVELSGFIQKKSFTFEAAIPLDVKISEKASMKDLKLGVDSGKKAVSIALSFELTQPELVLEAALSSQVTFLKLSGKMIGMWNSAFGIKYLAVENLLLSATFTPPSAVPTAFELGGTLHLGEKPKAGKKDQRLVGAAYIGIDTIDATQNYLYCKAEATLEKIVQAFGIKGNLPKFLKETGFPEGVGMSYTTNPAGKSLPSFKIEIPMGLRLFGAFEFMGYRAYGDLNVFSDPLKINLNISLPVIKLGNVASFRASPNKNGKGVNAALEFDSTEPMSTKLSYSGYIELFGSYNYADMEVDSTHFKVKTGSKLFNVFMSEISVAASYGNIKEASFTAEVMIKQEGLGHLSESLRDKLKKKMEEGKKKMNAAHDKLEQEKRNCKKKLGPKCDDCKKALYKTCDATYSTCSSFCFGPWSGKCKKECQKAKDGCRKGMDKTCAGSCLAVENIAKGLCSPVDAAQATVDGVQKTYGSIIKVSIAAMQPDKIFSIRQVDFSTKISVSELGSVNAGIKMVVLGSNKEYSSNVNLKSLAGGADGEISKLFNKIYEQVKNAFGG